MFSKILRSLKKSRFEKHAGTSFFNYYQKIEQCEAYKNFCQEVQGQPYSIQNNLNKEQYLAIINELSKKTGLKILELGCGTGKLIEQFQYSHQFTGVDLAYSNQELGIKKENYLDFDFKNEFYDLVLSIDSLYMITDEKKLIKKIHHSLKSGGHFDLHITFINSKRRDHLLKILKSIFHEVFITDYSHQDKLLWLKSNDYLIKNKLSFSSDVCKNVYMTKSNEVTKNLSLSKSMIRLHIRCTK